MGKERNIVSKGDKERKADIKLERLRSSIEEIGRKERRERETKRE